MAGTNMLSCISKLYVPRVCSILKSNLTPSKPLLKVQFAKTSTSLFNSTGSQQTLLKENEQEDTTSASGSGDYQGQRSGSSSSKLSQRNNYFKTKDYFLRHFQKKVTKGEPLSVTDAFVLLKACGPRMVGETDEVRTELVKQVWKELQENGTPLGIGLWNTLLSVYVDNRHEFEPLQFLKELSESSSADPNKTTFLLLTEAYALKGDPVGAMKVVDYMMETGEKMTDDIYALLIQAFAKKGDMEGVEQILESMSANKMKPRHLTYNALINAHAERGDIDKIGKVIEEMVSRKFYPTTQLYLSLFDHLARGGHRQLIPKVWEQIDDIQSISSDIQPLIQSFITRGDYSSALQLAVCSTPQKSTQMSAYIRYVERKLFSNLLLSEKPLSEFAKVSFLVEQYFSTKPRHKDMVIFFLQKDRPEMALGILSHLKNEYCVNVTAKDFQPIIEYFSEKKEVKSIFETYDRMITVHNVKPDFLSWRPLEPMLVDYGSENFNDVLEALQERDSKAYSFGVIREMVKHEDLTLKDLSKVVSSTSGSDLFSSIKQIKSILFRDFNPEDAAKVVISLHKNGMGDAGVLVNEILNAKELCHLHESDSDDMYKFVKTLVENKVPLHSQSFTKVLKHLHSAGDSDKFFMFLKLMKENGYKPNAHQYYHMLKMAVSVENSMAAQFCFDQIKDSDLFQTRKNEVYRLLLIAYSKDKEAPKAESAYLEEKISENSHKVCQLFEEMEANGLRISPLCVDLAVKSYLVNHDIASAKSLIEKYGRPGKNEGSLDHAFLKAYVSTGDFEAAQSLFESMKKNNNARFFQYNEMLRICALTGDVVKSEQLYSEMKEKGMVPNVYTYLQRVRAYITNKQPEKCVEVLEENIASGNLLLRVEIFMLILRNLVPTGDIESVDKVIALIKKYYLTKVPPKRLEHAQILVRLKAGCIEEASKFLIQGSDGNLVAEVELNPYRKVAKTALMEGDVDYIRNISMFLQENDLHYQTVDTFYVLALDKVDDIAGVRDLYERRLREGVEMSEKFLSILKEIIEARGLENFLQ